MKITDLYYVNRKMVLLEQTHPAILVRKKSPLFEAINDVVGRIVEGGIFVHVVEWGIDKETLVSKFDSPTLADTYCAISVT